MVRALLRSGHPEARNRIRYLRHHRAGLQDYRLRAGFADPELRTLGAAEGNVDKVLANRMCKRGMAWSIAGARRMAKVLEASHNHVLQPYLPHRLEVAHQPRRLKKFKGLANACRQRGGIR